jgi:hypothetical protein
MGEWRQVTVEGQEYEAFIRYDQHTKRWLGFAYALPFGRDLALTKVAILKTRLYPR